MALNFGDWAAGDVTANATGAAKRIRQFLDIVFPLGVFGSSDPWISTSQTGDFVLSIIMGYDAERIDVEDLSNAERLTLPGNILSGNTIHESLRMSAGRKVTGIKVSTVTSPVFTSAGGTFTLAVAKDIDGGGNNMLSAATFDLEAIDPLVDANVGLTLVSADLEFAAAGFMRLSVVSDVANLTPTAATDALLITIITEPI